MINEDENIPGTSIVVPIRYPPKPASVDTLREARAIADRFEDAHLYILHVNIVQKNEAVSRAELSSAVRRAVGPLSNASYHVRDAFLVEESILYEAVQLQADYVVIGKNRRARWQQLLMKHLSLTADIETFLQTHLEAELIVV